MKVDEKFCIAFNTLRNENQNREFSRKEIQELLINHVPDFSKQDYMISILATKNIIRRIGSGRNTKYMFTSTPIHISALSDAIFGLKAYNKDHFKKGYDKRKKQREIEVPNNYTQINEEYCIKFLKERGYKIMKRIINFEEV